MAERIRSLRRWLEVVKRHDDAGTQVQFAKLAPSGLPLDAIAFPTFGLPAFGPWRVRPTGRGLAVARQESEFIWRAAPRAGAKGLMQMLPTTAAATARQAGVDFDSARLVDDPGFNIRLGANISAI